MAGRSSNINPARPVLTAKQSNSVPTTPHQRPRHGFGSGSRTPSPRGLSSNHSPRSAFSEAVSSSINTNKPRSFCKYEKTPALSKRRMQYNIGDAPLDPPPNKPKKSLDPIEEKKLSGDMRELYDRLLPTKESEDRRKQFIEKLERILYQEWPSSEFNVHVFGSSGNLLCTSDSDVDICIQTPLKELESMHMLAAALDKHGMQHVLCIPAKVPIVKIWDPELKLAADLNVNNTLALENTRMIKTYIQIDKRVRPLAMVIKHWSRMRILNDAGIGGTISSYAWICLILNFLQTRKPPILPCLKLPSRQANNADVTTEASFDDTQEIIKNFDKDNKSSIGDLLFQFFRYYGYEFDYNALVVSVRQGKVLTRKEKGWTTSSKDGQWRLCVEEPFNTSRNLGNSADATSFRGIHLELRDAFINICNLKIDKLMEPYEFPAEDKQAPSIFKKAPAVPKPTLTAAPAASNRKGSQSMRHNKHNPRGNYSGPSSRRASASSTYGRGGQGPFSPPLVHNDWSQQVANNWAMLQPHTALLKQQMYGNVPLHPAQAYQLALAQAQTAVHGGHGNQRENNQSMAKPGGQRMFSNSFSSEHMTGMSQMVQPTLYYTTSEQVTPLLQSTSHDGPRTNPSSPSLATSIPVRRGLQRSSINNGNPTASVRSQSQPARGLPQSMLMPFQIPYDPSNAMPYYTTTNADNVAYQGLEQQYAYMMALQNSASQQVEQQPKEYVGYYVDSKSNQHASLPNHTATLPRIPSHTDLAQRRDRGNDKLFPLDLSGNRKLSRSPSPLGHARHSSTPPKSAPLPVATNSRSSNMNAGISTERRQSPPVVSSPSAANPLGGLLIVNGSSFSSATDPIQHNGSSMYSTTASDDASQNFFDANGQVGPGQAIAHNGGASHAHAHAHVARITDQSTSTGRHPSSGIDLSQVSSIMGSPLQPFPSYSEPVVPLMSQEEEVVTSPTRVQQSPWQSFAVPNGAAPHPSMTKNGKDVMKSPVGKSLPFLSPVIESRMPTPQMQRRIDLHNQQSSAPVVNGGSQGNGVVTNGALPIRSVEPIPPTPLSMSTATMMAANASSLASSAAVPSAGNHAQTWQTQTQTKRRSGNRKRSKSGPTARSSGATSASAAATPAITSTMTTRNIEPLPALPQDRKGG